MKKMGYGLLVSLLSILMVACDSGSSSDDESNPSGPSSSKDDGGRKNSFTCDVSKEGDNIVQRMTLNQFGIIEKSTMTYAPGADGWTYSAELLFDGLAAESMAADACEEFKSESENVSCTGNKVSYSMNIGDIDDTSKLMAILQKDCDEMESEYNGVDFDGPSETPSELPTSCKVTDGESSLTLNIVYSDWTYTSTVTFSGSKSHEVELYSGNYGDRAEKQCAFDKAEGGIVVCDGPSIILDDDWGMELSIDEMKTLTQYACELLLDGTMSFEEFVMEE